MRDPFDLAAGWLQEHVLLPLLYALGWMRWEEVAYGWALFAVYGLAQVGATSRSALPLERWRPVERWTGSRRRRGRCAVHAGSPASACCRW